MIFFPVSCLQSTDMMPNNHKRLRRGSSDNEKRKRIELVKIKI